METIVKIKRDEEGLTQVAMFTDRLEGLFPDDYLDRDEQRLGMTQAALSLVRAIAVEFECKPKEVLKVMKYLLREESLRVARATEGEVENVV